MQQIDKKKALKAIKKMQQALDADNLQLFECWCARVSDRVDDIRPDWEISMRFYYNAFWEGAEREYNYFTDGFSLSSRNRKSGDMYQDIDYYAEGLMNSSARVQEYFWREYHPPTKFKKAIQPEQIEEAIKRLKAKKETA